MFPTSKPRYCKSRIFPTSKPRYCKSHRTGQQLAASIAARYGEVI